MKKHLLFSIVTCILLLSGLRVSAQYPTYSCKITAASQVSCNMFEFDVTLQRIGTTVFKLAMIQMGININPAIIPAGAHIDVSIVQGSSQLSSQQQLTQSHFSFDSTNSCIRVTPVSPPGTANATTISNAPAGTKICRIRVACSQPFVTGISTNPTWCFTFANGYQTKVFAYVGTTNTDITVQASHYLAANSSLTLAGGFSDPLPKTVNTDINTICMNGNTHATITVANSQSGITYYLYKDGIPLAGSQACAFGQVGADVSFAYPVSSAGVYSVKSPSCTGMVDMQNSVTITEVAASVASVSMTWVNSGNSFICTAHPVNAGTGLWFTWYVNGVDQGVYNPDFIYTPQPGEVVYCCLFVDGTSNCVTNSGQCIPSNTLNVDSLLTTCNFTANITPAGTVMGCIGDSVQLMCNTVAGATYLWSRNGVVIPYTHTDHFYAHNSGDYSVSVITNNCTVNSNVVSVTIHNFPAVPVITQSGSFNSCGDGNVTLSATAGAASYQWSNGDSTQSIVISTPGSYIVGVGNSYGCVTNSSAFTVTSTPMTAPEICMVSVDAATGHNMIIWDKPVSTVIDHFNVYSEGSQANVFNLIGSVNYSFLSEFIDTASNPLQQSYRYKISAADTCGTETALSLYHKTIHLSISLGMGNTINLAWNQYEGFSFITYNIYRGTNASNMTLLTALPYGSTSYTDLTPPAGLVYYQIEAVNPNSCTASKTIYTGARSNIASNDNIYVGVSSNESDSRIEIYPNPAANILNITGYSNNTRAEVYDVSGKVLLSGTILSDQIDISSLANGLYFIKLITNDGSAIRKFVKE